MKGRNLLIFLVIIFMIGFVFAEEYYEFEWDEEDIRNGENFKIKILFFNLEDKEYDVKLWIDDDGKLISDRDYGEWKSGWFYMNGIVEGPGNFSERVKLRIDEEYKDFKGDAKLYFKIRGKEEIINDIEVLKMKKEEINEAEELEEGVDEDSEDEGNNSSFVKENVSGNIDVISKVIILGRVSDNMDVEETENIKSQNNIVYESNTEIIKNYSVYSFALFCVVICVLIIWRKLE